MAAITALTITITPPGGSPFPVNLTDPDAVTEGEVSAVGPIQIGWGVEYPGQPQAAGNFAIAFYSATPNPVPFGSLAVIAAQVDGAAARTIARGWASTPKWVPYDTVNGQTRWLTRVAFEDIVGRLTAAKLPPASWPAETMDDRLERVRDAAGIAEFFANGYWLVAAKDIQGSESPWAVLTELLADPTGNFALIETDGGPGIRHAEFAPAFAFNSAGFPGHVSLSPSNVLDVPAAALGQVWRGQNRATSPSQITVGWVNAGEQVQTVLTADTPSPFQSGEIEIGTIRTSFPAELAAQVKDRLQDLATNPAVVPDSAVPVKLDQLDTDTLTQLIAIPADATTVLPVRAGRIIRILGAHYADMDSLQTVVAGNLTIQPDLKATLNVQLLSPRVGGARPVAFSDLPDGTDGVWEPVLFGDFLVNLGPATAKDTLAVLSPGYIHH